MKTVDLKNNKEYKYGFTTEVDQETFPKVLNEDIVRKISAKKNEKYIAPRENDELVISYANIFDICNNLIFNRNLVWKTYFQK